MTIPSTWLAALDDLLVVETGDANATAIDNMTVLSLAAIQAAGSTPDQIVDFLDQAHHCYARAAERAGIAHGWFYAWHDEQAGQLRMSLSTAVSAEALPFRCQLDRHDDTRRLAAAIIGDTAAGAVALSELEPPAPADPADTPQARPYVLDVLVRCIGPS